MSTIDNNQPWYIYEIQRLSDENRDLRKVLTQNTRGVPTPTVRDGGRRRRVVNSDGTITCQRRSLSHHTDPSCTTRVNQICHAVAGTQSDKLTCQLGANLASRGVTPSTIQEQKGYDAMMDLGMRIHTDNCSEWQQSSCFSDGDDNLSILNFDGNIDLSEIKKDTSHHTIYRYYP